VIISLWAGMSTAKKWQMKHAMQYGMVGFKLYLASLRTRGSGGWRTFEIGVFHGSFGGVTKCLHIT
jgi:hypothetical protein